MAGKPLRQSGAKKKATVANETSESLEQKIELFLKSGKKIEVVDSGISGKPILGTRSEAPRRGDK